MRPKVETLQVRGVSRGTGHNQAKEKPGAGLQDAVRSEKSQEPLQTAIEQTSTQGLERPCDKANRCSSGGRREIRLKGVVGSNPPNCRQVQALQFNSTSGRLNPRVGGKVGRVKRIQIRRVSPGGLTKPSDNSTCHHKESGYSDQIGDNGAPSSTIEE